MEPDSRKSHLNVYIQKVWIAVAIGAAVLSLLLLLWKGFDVVLIIAAGVLLGLLLLVPADGLAARSFLSRRWALAVVLVVIAGMSTLFGVTFATSISEQFQQLSEALPTSVEGFKNRIASWPMGAEIISRLEQGQSAGNVLGQWFSRISSFLTSTLGLLTNLFFIVFIALFFAFEPDTYRRGLLHMIAPARRNGTMDLLHTLRHRLSWWMLGRMVSMITVGVATGVGLWLIGMPMALSLALLAALLVVIPNLGPLLAAIPALLVAATEGLLWPVLLLYLGIQAVESNLITPMIDRKSVKLPPALLISAQLSLGLIAGLLGLLLAAPLTVIAMVVVQKAYLDDALDAG